MTDHSPWPRSEPIRDEWRGMSRLRRLPDAWSPGSNLPNLPNFPGIRNSGMFAGAGGSFGAGTAGLAPRDVGPALVSLLEVAARLAVRPGTTFVWEFVHVCPRAPTKLSGSRRACVPGDAFLFPAAVVGAEENVRKLPRVRRSRERVEAP